MEATYSDSRSKFGDSSIFLEKMEVYSRAGREGLRQDILAGIQRFLNILQNIDSYELKNISAEVETAILKSAAKRILDARSLRVTNLPPSMLGEPAWDMMLALFTVDEPLITKALCLAARVPQTTAVRWLLYLEQAGYVKRAQDDHDARRVMVSLSEKGEGVMRDVIRSMTGLLGMDALNAPATHGWLR